jgi:hypothetical protein
MLARSTAREDNGQSPMTASRPSHPGAPTLAWALCGLTVAVALGGLVLAIADPNTFQPSHISLWLRERAL